MRSALKTGHDAAGHEGFVVVQVREGEILEAAGLGMAPNTLTLFIFKMNTASDRLFLAF